MAVEPAALADARCLNACNTKAWQGMCPLQIISLGIKTHPCWHMQQQVCRVCDVLLVHGLACTRTTGQREWGTAPWQCRTGPSIWVGPPAQAAARAWLQACLLERHTGLRPRRRGPCHARCASSAQMEQVSANTAGSLIGDMAGQHLLRRRAPAVRASCPRASWRLPAAAAWHTLSAWPARKHSRMLLSIICACEQPP